MNKDSNLSALQLTLYPKATSGTEESGRWGDVRVVQYSQIDSIGASGDIRMHFSIKSTLDSLKCVLNAFRGESSLGAPEF